MFSRRGCPKQFSPRSRAIAAVAVCATVAALIVLVAGGGGAAAVARAGAAPGGTLPGGNDIRGKTISFFIGDSASNQFWVPVVNGAKAAAALTGVKLQLIYGSSTDETTNINSLKTVLARRPSALAVRAATPAFNRVLCDAQKRHIPLVVFNINGTTEAAAKCIPAFIGQDFVQSGRLIAQRMIDEGKIKQGAKVFCPVELPTQTYAVERAAGVNAALKTVGSKCSILGTGVELGPAKAAMVSYLLGHRDTTAIIALGGTPLTVAPAVVKQVKKNIAIGGFDLSQPIMSAIESGAITATVDQQPYDQGFYSVLQLALQLKYGLSPANVDTSTGALIDKSNVANVRKLVPAFR